SATQSLQIRGIFFFGCRQIQSVIAGVVQKIPLDPPHLVVHLIPFRSRIDLHFHCAQIERAFPSLRRRSRRGDKPALPLLVQHFFAVRRYREGSNPAQERLRLPGRQVKLRHRHRCHWLESRHGRHPPQKKRPPTSPHRRRTNPPA